MYVFICSVEGIGGALGLGEQGFGEEILHTVVGLPN